MLYIGQRNVMSVKSVHLTVPVTRVGAQTIKLSAYFTK